MKKTFLLSLLTSVFLLSSATATFAATNGDTKTTTGVTQASFIQIMNKEISGVVENISDSEMTVKTEDGINYSVPLYQFSKDNDLNDLGIIVGTKVSLKGIAQGMQADVTMTAKALTPEEIEKLEKGVTQAVPQAIRALTPDEVQQLGKGITQEGKLLFIATEITANGETVSLSK